MKLRNITLTAVVASVMVLAGCISNSSKLNKVALGMTKQEVIKAMGSPSNTRASAGVEYLVYRLCLQRSLGQCYNVAEFFVQIEENRVIQYGKVGDFDSTQKPESTINVNKKVKVE